MIIFIIKSCFFCRANSYSLGQKPYTLHFFLFFYKKILKIAYAIFAVTIENLEMRIGNLNLLLGKSVIQFEFLAQKEENDK